MDFLFTYIVIYLRSHSLQFKKFLILIKSNSKFLCSFTFMISTFCVNFKNHNQPQGHENSFLSYLEFDLFLVSTTKLKVYDPLQTNFCIWFDIKVKGFSFPHVSICLAIFIQKIIFSPHWIEAVSFSKSNDYICMCLFLVSISILLFYLFSFAPIPRFLTTIILHLYSKSKCSRRRLSNLFFFKTVLAIYILYILSYTV